jgi:hypothetical protein
MSKLGLTRAQAVLGVIGIIIVVVAMWYGLLDTPRTRLQSQLRAREKAVATLDKARKQIADAAKTKLTIDAAAQHLEEMEARMPAGDPYRWLIKAFLDFPAATNVVLANIEPPHISETTILPKVPYKTATFILTGTAYYHDFGMFLAALENDFPHMRLKRLELTPGYPGEAESEEAERLNFQLEIMAFFKASAPAGPGQLSLAPESKQSN